MPDELDYISERAEKELQMRIDAERSKKVEAPKGTCLYCFTVCAPDASFCDDECAGAYQEEQGIKQFQATGKRG
mgnify:CR=1 FL=1